MENLYLLKLSVLLRGRLMRLWLIQYRNQYILVITSYNWFVLDQLYGDF